MTEKIIVIPQEVRGLGNIVDEKELTDYNGVQSVLTESTDSVLGKEMTVYTMEATGYHLSLTLGGPSVVYGHGVYCFATLTDIEGDAVSDASIKFYVDDTLRDTQSTNSSGKATTTTGTNLAVGSHSIKAVYTTDDEDIIATATLTVTKRPTVLTINTPALVYSDEFDVTGTLKNSSDNEGIGNATVTLHWKVGDGPEQTATATTGQYGAVTFHRSAPTSVTDYTFWMTYDGTATRNGASTSEITVTVDKETSVLNVTSPTSGANLTDGDNIAFTGSLLDNDGHTLQGTPFLQVKYYQGGSLVGSVSNLSVENDGSFSWSLSNPFSVGSGKIVVSFIGSDEYTAVSTEINVTVGFSYDSIVVTADKNILSYADNETAVLYAQLKKNGVNYNQAGVEITFKGYSATQGVTGVLGTASTNSSGLAVLSSGYASHGWGDMNITATDGTLVSETYEVHDYWKYIANGSYTGTSTISFQELYESSAYDNIEISTTIKAPNKGFGLAFLKSKDSSSSIQDNIFNIGVDGGNYLSVARIENGNITVYTSSLFQEYTANSDLNCVIRIENGVVTLKLNSYIYTSTPITGLKYVGVRNWNNAKTVTYTDFIVKPL